MLLRLYLQSAEASSQVKRILYQSPGAQSGLTVTVDVFRPDKSQDSTQSGTANEIGTTGRYYFSFTADNEGWFALIHDDAGGNGVRQF